MMVIVQKYRIFWVYDTDLPNEFEMFIHARNTEEATNWFNKISHGLKIVKLLVISPYEEKENQQKGSRNE